jgi:hypothetical protein
MEALRLAVAEDIATPGDPAPMVWPVGHADDKGAEACAAVVHAGMLYLVTSRDYTRPEWETPDPVVTVLCAGEREECARLLAQVALASAYLGWGV